MTKCKNQLGRAVDGSVSRHNNWPAALRRGPKTISSLVRNGTWSMTAASAAERLASVLSEEGCAGPRTASWTPRDSRSVPESRSSAVENSLIRSVDGRRLLQRWLAEMALQGVPVEPVSDVLVGGASLSHTDSAYGRRNGWAKAQLLAAVEILMGLEKRN